MLALHQTNIPYWWENPRILALHNCVYCLHLERPLSDKSPSQHYVGFAEDLIDRFMLHQRGKGARFTQVAVERNIAFHVVWSIPGDRRVERAFKDMGNAKLFCPICKGTKARSITKWLAKHRGLSVVPDAIQLELPIDDFEGSPYRGPVDWYEIRHYRQQRQQYTAPVYDPGDTSDCALPY